MTTHPPEPYTQADTPLGIAHVDRERLRATVEALDASRREVAGLREALREVKSVVAAWRVAPCGTELDDLRRAINRALDRRAALAELRSRK